MSEHNAPNSELNSDKKYMLISSRNNNNDHSTNDRKRKSEMQNNTMSKQLKNNYYEILDNDEHCNKEYLDKFEKHVHEHGTPTSQSSSHTEKNANNENVIKQDRNKKIPPLNIFNVEPNSLIEFIKKGLDIDKFKIKELNNKKKLHCLCHR